MRHTGDATAGRRVGSIFPDTGTTGECLFYGITQVQSVLMLDSRINSRLRGMRAMTVSPKDAAATDEPLGC